MTLKVIVSSKELEEDLNKKIKRQINNSIKSFSSSTIQKEIEKEIKQQLNKIDLKNIIDEQINTYINNKISYINIEVKLLIEKSLINSIKNTKFYKKMIKEHNEKILKDLFEDKEN